MKIAAPSPCPGPELFPVPGPELRREMEALLPLIEKTFPVPTRFRWGLADDVAELSRLLTSARAERSPSYLNRPPMLSAYLRYFLPWNLYRLCRLLPSLELPLAAGDRILDLGAGPLTLPIALWLCRPELRDLPLEFHCRDFSRAALDAGKKLFSALGPCPWIIRAQSGTRPAPAEKQALVAVVNMYNELFQPLSPGDEGGLYRLAKTQGAFLAARAGRGGRILIVEPGVPRSGQFIALLREVLIGLGRPPLSPCTHDGPCPFPGLVRGAGSRIPPGLSRRSAGGPPESGPAAGGGPIRDAGKGLSKWCHFAFDTQGAPAGLQRLSAAAGLPKERATLSFLLAGPAPAEPGAGDQSSMDRGQGPEDRGPRKAPPVSTDRGFAAGGFGIPLPEDREGPRSPIRIISDPFPLGAGREKREWGRYGCAGEGMALVRGERPLIESLVPGALIRVVFTGRRDLKSGALLCHPAGAE
jgi:hypothetical protein